jgi:arabinogalactan oligomer / maltooligosaccharide transport system permease protein
MSVDIRKVLMPSAPSAVPKPRRRIVPRRKADLGLSILGHAYMIVLSIFAIAPLAWAISSAFKPDSEMLGAISLLPHHPTLSHFRLVISQTSFPRWFLNSSIVALSTTVLAIVIGTLGGYAMSRFRFAGRNLYGNTLLVIQMFPGVMLAIPLFLILSNYHLVNTLWALVVTYLTFSLAFAVWMLKGYFDGIPKEIEEAATIDGASRLQILWRLIIPLAGPGITTVAVYAFLLAWNEFFFAYIFLASNDKYTLSLGMYTFIQQFTTQWGNVMAAGVLTTIPVLVAFFAVQRALTRGLIAGSVKG